MMQKVNPISRRWWAALTVFCLINVVAHLVFYGQMPDVVPSHWGADGAPDAWGAKQVTLLFDVLPLLLLGLFWLIPRLEPKHDAYEKSAGVYRGFVVLFTAVMAVSTWITEATVFGWLPTDRAAGLMIPMLIGVFFILVGNYMPRIRQNYTFGVKTPWTLDDPENWRRTQRFGGRCFIVMGLSLVAIGVTGGGSLAVAGCAAVIVAAVAAIYAYSYLLWRHARSGEK